MKHPPTPSPTCSASASQELSVVDVSVARSSNSAPLVPSTRSIPLFSCTSTIGPRSGELQRLKPRVPQDRFTLATRDEDAQVGFRAPWSVSGDSPHNEGVDMPEDPPPVLPLVTSDEEASDDRSPAEQPEQGTALCLSGGGYRAMLFHVGALLYLNERTWLTKLDRISRVSGGSITAAVLGMNWPRLTFQNGIATNFDDQVVRPLRGLASTTIDRNAILGGIFRDDSIGNKLVETYKEQLFGNTTLQQLPDRPRFVINATSVQSGALFRFSKPYIWDYRVGKIAKPTRPLAEAVAASSAFPPVLSPVRLDFKNKTFVAGTGTDLQREPFTTEVVLTDGGVYDNMRIETAWKRYSRILVSDAGGKMQPEESPKDDWARHSLRINGVIDNQVRSLRKRQIISSFTQKTREGAYWGIRSDISQHGATNSLPCRYDQTRPSPRRRPGSRRCRPSCRNS
jgi:NTE family protein